MNQNWESSPIELNKRHHATPAAAFLVKIMGVWYGNLVCNMQPALSLSLMFWIYQGKGSAPGQGLECFFSLS